MASLIVNGSVVTAEVANTPASRARGLQFRDPIPLSSCMLFVFPTDDEHPFWTPNLRFNLDMVWLDSNWNVVAVARDIPPSPNYVVYSYKVSRYAIEARSGFVDAYGVRVGNVFSYQP